MTVQIVRWKSVFLFLLLAPLSIAVVPPEPRMKADEVSKDQMSGITILKGHAAVYQGVHKLKADKILVDPQMRYISAQGNCIYQTPGKIKKTDQMVFQISDGHWEPHRQ